MLVLVYLLATAVVQLQSFTIKRQVSDDSCRISLNQHLPSIAPLVINGSKELLYPSEDDTIILAPGTPFLLYCESSFSDRNIQERGIQVTCNKLDTVTYAGNSYQFSRLGCIKHPDSTVHKMVGSCAGQHSLIDIGFEYTRFELNGDNEDGIDEGIDEGTDKDIDKDTDEGIDEKSQDVEREEEGGDEGANIVEVKETVVEAIGTGNTEASKDAAKISSPEFPERGNDQNGFPSENVTAERASSSKNSVVPDVTVEKLEDTDNLGTKINNRKLGQPKTAKNPITNALSSKGETSTGSDETTLREGTYGETTETGNGSIIRKSAPFKIRRKFQPRQPARREGEGATEFIKLIQVCYDFTRHTTLYSVHSLDGRIRGRQRSVKRTPFKPDIFQEENIEVNYLYTHKGQTERLTKILGSEDLAKKYIQNDDHFLSRGHYSPKADFIFGAEQIATFYFINVAPQWQTFNGGNWVSLENAVRDLTMKEPAKIQVYTGTYGVISLKDINDNDVEIYLGEKDGRQIVPVPKYFWKVIYNPQTKDGLAVVGLNNPYLEVSEKDVLCEDVCHAYPWVDWDLKNQKKGYTFCCLLAEFQKKFIDLGLELP